MRSAPSRSTKPSARSTASTFGFTRASRSVAPSLSTSSWIAASCSAPCESMKLTPSRSSTSARSGAGPSSASSRTRSSSAWARREEEAAVEPEHDDAGERLVARVLVEVAEHLRPGLAPEQRHRRRRGDVDEPAEREHDADHHSREHPGRQHRDDRGDGDPEVESRDAAEPAQLARRRSSRTRPRR